MSDYHMRQSGAHAEEERSLTMARTASKAKIPHRRLQGRGAQNHQGANQEEVWRRLHHASGRRGFRPRRRGDSPPARSRSMPRSVSVAFPRGRIVEIYGPESSGKTTLSLQIVAEAQALGGVAAFIDAEHASTPSMPRRSASTSTNCSSPNLTRASRRSKSAICSSVPTPSPA